MCFLQEILVWNERVFMSGEERAEMEDLESHNGRFGKIKARNLTDQPAILIIGAHQKSEYFHWL